jgi:hypothetical protein
LPGAKTTGLAPGASVPEILVADAIEALSALCSVALTALSGIAENEEFKLRPNLTIDSRAA